MSLALYPNHHHQQQQQQQTPPTSPDEYVMLNFSNHPPLPLPPPQQQQQQLQEFQLQLQQPQPQQQFQLPQPQPPQQQQLQLQLHQPQQLQLQPLPQQQQQSSVLVTLLTEEVARDLQGLLDGNVQVQVYLTSYSSLMLSHSLNARLDPPQEQHTSLMLLLARYERWHQTVRELGARVRWYLHNPVLDDWTISRLFMDESTRNLSHSVKSRYEQSSVARLLDASTFAAEKFPNFKLVHEYLSAIVSRTHQTQGAGYCSSHSTDAPILNHRKRAHSVLTDQTAITIHDIAKIREIVRDILFRVVRCAKESMAVACLLKLAHFTDAEIGRIIRISPASDVVKDLYQRGEIPYGLHWLRDWFPVWYVEHWDPSWSKSEMFSGGGVPFRRQDGQGSVVKELQAMYRIRYREIITKMDMSQRLRHKMCTWSDVMSASLYYYV